MLCSWPGTSTPCLHGFSPGTSASCHTVLRHRIRLNSDSVRPVAYWQPVQSASCLSQLMLWPWVGWMDRWIDLLNNVKLYLRLNCVLLFTGYCCLFCYILACRIGSIKLNFHTVDSEMAPPSAYHCIYDTGFSTALHIQTFQMQCMMWLN